MSVTQARFLMVTICSTIFAPSSGAHLGYTAFGDRLTLHDCCSPPIAALIAVATMIRPRCPTPISFAAHRGIYFGRPTFEPQWRSQTIIRRSKRRSLRDVNGISRHGCSFTPFAASRGVHCGRSSTRLKMLAFLFHSPLCAAFIAGTHSWASSSAACLVSFAANRGVHCGDNLAKGVLECLRVIFAA
jgi:hypothetical protein